MVKGVFGNTLRIGENKHVSAWFGEWSKYNYPNHLKKKLSEYDQKGILGDVALDIGCGPKPLSFNLDSIDEIILVDIVPMVKSLEYGDKKLTKIWADVDEMLIHGTYPHLGTYGEIDTVIASSLFNYVDWKNLLHYQKDIHNQGGYLFIANMINKGSTTKSLFSDKRPSSTKEIVETLPKFGYIPVEIINENMSIIIAKKE